MRGQSTFRHAKQTRVVNRMNVRAALIATLAMIFVIALYWVGYNVPHAAEAIFLTIYASFAWWLLYSLAAR